MSSFGRRSRSVCDNQGERPALVTKANRPVPEFLPFRGIRYALNEDAMATEKLAEGIRAFAVDAAKLDAMIEAMK